MAQNTSAKIADTGVKCPYCSGAVAADDEICTHCGARLTADCTFCGAPLLPGECVYPEFAEGIYVSGTHGEFRFSDGVWQVRDLGSTNGTFVDGRRLNKGEWKELSPGMLLKMATVKYELNL